MQVATLISGVLLIAMSILTAVLAITGPSMPTTGWQVTLTSRLQHYANNVTTALGSVPGWVFLLALVAALVFLATRALSQVDTDNEEDGDDDDIERPAPLDDERIRT
jgi:uncharacterized membrane protein